jgi:hypothetical protein
MYANKLRNQKDIARKREKLEGWTHRKEYNAIIMRRIKYNVICTEIYIYIYIYICIYVVFFITLIILHNFQYSFTHGFLPFISNLYSFKRFWSANYTEINMQDSFTQVTPKESQWRYCDDWEVFSKSWEVMSDIPKKSWN